MAFRAFSKGLKISSLLTVLALTPEVFVQCKLKPHKAHPECHG